MLSPPRNPKICIVVTVDISLDKLFPDFYHRLITQGWQVTGICADGPCVENVKQQGVRVITVPMTRQFTFIQDLKCLWLLFKIFKREGFDIIHYSTPKASLLASVAGRMVNCPVLLYTLRGLGYTAFGGLKRYIAKFCEKIVCRSAHHVIAISNSLKEKALKEKLLPENKVEVLGTGSSKGVDLCKFQINENIKAKGNAIRKELGIKSDEIVIGYAGRLTKEKGIVELLTAFERIKKHNQHVHILMVGNQDGRNPLPQDVIDLITIDMNIHTASFSDDVVPYIAAMDILVLPSHREGFGNVLIEASAMQKPVIATDIPGCRDAVRNEVTGLLVEPYNIESLEKGLKTMIANPSKRAEMGLNGKKWVEDNFDSNLVWNRTTALYRKLLS